MGSMENYSIAIIDDETSILELMTEYFGMEGFQVEGFKSAEIFLEVFKDQDFDCLIVDWNLPGLNGLEIVREVRKTKKMIPIFMSTANNTHSEIIQALDAGADDYMIKPYELEELLFRVKNAIRKFSNYQGGNANGEITLIDEGRVVINGDLKISLTPKEFSIMSCLLKNKSHTISRDQLLAHMYEDQENKAISRNIDVHIVSLRKKVAKVGIEIETIRGIGYRVR